MSKAVWKHTIPVDDQPHAVSWPVGFRLLHVDCQGLVDAVSVWALVDPAKPMADARNLQVFGTGHEVPDDATYLGTAVTAGGALVWHLFDLSPSPRTVRVNIHPPTTDDAFGAGLRRGYEEGRRSR